MSENNKTERDWKRLLPLFLLVVLISASVYVLVVSPSYYVIVTGSDSKCYRARKICIAGNTLLCLKGRKTHDSIDAAIKSVREDYAFAIVPMSEISRIDIVHEIPDKVDEETVLYDPLAVPLNYFGMYALNAAGNVGYLYLGIQNGVIYGFIRFPQWANGVPEPLKGLMIIGNRIQFVRSVTTPEELRRVGANAYFIQNYYGEYKQGGDVIQGYYDVAGNRKMWDSSRAR